MKQLEKGELFTFQGVKALCIGLADYRHSCSKDDTESTDVYLCYTQGLLFMFTHVYEEHRGKTTIDAWCVTKVFDQCFALPVTQQIILANKDFNLMSENDVRIELLEGDWQYDWGETK